MIERRETAQDRERFLFDTSEASLRLLAAVLGQAVWPIVARVNGQWQPSGTGFVISTCGLMMTAKHIVEPAAMKRGRALSAEGKWYDEGQLFAFRLAPTPAALPARTSRMYHIDRTTYADRGDVAICQLRSIAVNEKEMPLTALSIRPGLPRLRERVYVLGFDGLDISVTHETEHELAVHCTAGLHLTFGAVEEIFLPERDRVLAPFPCFRINAPVKPGMSGAPVINEAGAVCGIVSSSPSWEPSATCAMMALPLAMKIDLLGSNGRAPRTALLYDLVKEGIVCSDGSLGDVRLVPEGDGYKVLVTDRREP